MQELQDRFKALEPTIAEILAISSSPGLSLGILHQGSIVHTAHFGRRDFLDPAPPNDDTIYRVASLTKALTSSAVALLVEEGILGWDKPIREYLPAFTQRTDELGQKATLRDLLANRTGLTPADLMWGQQYGEFLLPKSELVRITTYLEAIRPFRERFLYSQWNYGLVTEVVESVIGKTLGTYIKERILDPMNMHRTTLGKPEGENISPGHAIRNNGTPCKIDFANMDDGTGLAGGFAAKTSVKDLLFMYQGLLRAKKDQTQTSLSSTPGSPFKHTRTIFSPHIGVAAFNVEDVAYCLGLYRTRLPGTLGVASINNVLLGPKKIPSLSGSPGLELYHHTGNIPGFLASAFLIPSTESAVVVLTNSLPFMDPTDFVGQLIVSTLIGEEPSSKLPSLARAARSSMLRAHPMLAATLAKHKTTKPPRSPITVYVGRYWNAAENFCLSITARAGGLLMRVQEAPRTNYHLEPYDGDTFYWPADREDELCERGMWPIIAPAWHKVIFGTSDEGTVSHLIWHHDPLARPEVFRRSEAHLPKSRFKL
jgi:CubicO group peptidase (beta-lactamase class C family)